MKDFFKYTTATILGIVISVVVLFLIGLFAVSGLLATASSPKPVTQPCLLRISLQGTLQERYIETPLATFLSDEQLTVGLDDILAGIHEAESNSLIQGIYLEGRGLTASPASLDELRQALLHFKAVTDKPIIAYADAYSQSDYYLCSVADKVILNPQGTVDWHGLAAQTVYFKELLSHCGITMQTFKVGTYKSAVEPFTDTRMSAANRTQLTAYTQSVWQHMLRNVSASRQLSTEYLHQLADRYMGMSTATACLQSGLVDSLLYMDGTKGYLQQLLHQDDRQPLSFITIADIHQFRQSVPPTTGSDAIAVYYAEGDIVDRASFYPNEQPEIVGETMCTHLRQLRDDPSIRAVVLRINSPGGSAFASEQIWHEVRALEAKKPVIVSMGDYAASGGYYIASAATAIVAQPTTLTGSIGIFGLIPDASELFTEKLHLHFETVQTNRHADFGHPGRPFNADEQALLQHYINDGYHTFVQRCAEGRHLSPAAIESVAQGRVWTGSMAVGNGLVDTLGNLDTAIRLAAEKAQLSPYRLRYYPQQPDIFTLLFHELKSDYMEAHTHPLLRTYGKELRFLTGEGHLSQVQARLPYTLHLIN